MGYRNRILDTLKDIGKYHEAATKAVQGDTAEDLDEVTRLLLCIAQASTEGLGELYESCGPFVRSAKPTHGEQPLPEGWTYDDKDDAYKHVSGASVANLATEPEEKSRWVYWYAGSEDEHDGGRSTREAAMRAALRQE